MNASTSIRASHIRKSVLFTSDTASPFHNGRVSAVKNWPNFTPVNHPNFTPVDHLEWKAKLDLERSRSPSDTEMADLSKFYVSQQEEQKRAVVVRMASVFPLKDMTYVVAILFVIGSICFTVNSFLGLFVLLQIPGPQFDWITFIALPATIHQRNSWIHQHREIPRRRHS
jgi:hypothetical protein